MVIYVGLPGSGKTTEALRLERLGWLRVNWDDMRAAMPNYSFKKDEENMQRASHQLAKSALESDQNVVIDNTNLSERTRNRWMDVAKRCHARYVIQHFDTPIDECIRRDATRLKRVGRPVIERMALMSGKVTFPADKKLVLVDMDGTLAVIDHRQHHVAGDRKNQNWPAFFAGVHLDQPCPVVSKWVKALYDDHIVCIVSGRPLDVCGDSTVDWLAAHEIPYHRIFMRNARDYDKDSIVKQAILDRLPKEQIAFCIDDRNQVVDMWRANGLKCFQVAEGAF